MFDSRFSEMQLAAWSAYQAENAPDTTFIASEVRRSRVSRRCDCCAGVIEPGQRYRRDLHRVDGDLEHSAFHLDVADCPQLQEEAGWAAMDEQRASQH